LERLDELRPVLERDFDTERADEVIGRRAQALLDELNGVRAERDSAVDIGRQPGLKRLLASHAATSASRPTGSHRRAGSGSEARGRYRRGTVVPARDHGGSAGCTDAHSTLRERGSCTMPPRRTVFISRTTAKDPSCRRRASS
jgi:hypothetical protein